MNIFRRYRVKQIRAYEGDLRERAKQAEAHGDLLKAQICLEAADAWKKLAERLVGVQP